MEIWFLVIFLIAIAELIANVTWMRFYFTTGILLFKKSVRVSEPPNLYIHRLNKQFSGGFWPPFCFKEMSSHEIAFRETFFSFRFLNYTPVMHGLIRYDETTSELQVVGFANWLVPLFVALFIAFTWYPRSLGAGIASVIGLILFPGGLVVLLYMIQFKRFAGVFNAISLQSERQRDV